jgi:radical SAM superfamily enzyme YgiQ (UPF0313 family)
MIIKSIEANHQNNRYDLRSLTPNLGPVVIASLLQQQGHEVEVISEYITQLNYEDLSNADLVGISITTYNAKRGFEIAQRLKNPVVFGGMHASLMPEECLMHGEYVIRGDGRSILKLVKYLAHGSQKDIRQVPNLVFKQDNDIIFNPSETSTINIAPDFSLVKDYYKPGLKRFTRVPLLVNASRGCPHKCTFCSIKAIYPDVRKKDTAIVIEDIKNQIDHKSFLSVFFPRIIWITDDNFFAEKNWAKDVLKELAKLKTGFKFVIQARPDIAYDDELLTLMKKANFGIVYMGIESLNPGSLENLKKDISTEDTLYAIKKIQSQGMAVHGLFVFGDDEFQKGDGLKTAQFAKEYNLSGALIQPLTPYPGTELFKSMKQANRILHEDWQYYNGKVVIKPRQLTAAELQKEIYDCYRSVYSLLRIIKFVLFGPRGFRLAGLGEAVFRHLEWLKCRNYIKDKLSDRGY